MTKSTVLKKISVPFIAVLALGGLLISSGQANALFDLSKSQLRATGTIVEIGSDKFMMDTGGTEPAFEIIVDRRTHFQRPLSGLSDLHVGDDVEVRARNKDGVFTGTKVEVTESGYGYGGNGSCERLRVSRATTVSITPTQIVVNRNGIDITAQITDNTRIRGFHNNRRVDVGDTVDIRGKDCGGNFVAERIVIRRPASNSSLNSHDSTDNSENDNSDENENDSPSLQ